MSNVDSQGKYATMKQENLIVVSKPPTREEWQKNQVCPECNKKTIRHYRSFVKHFKTFHLMHKSDYECPECKKNLQDAQSLQRHMTLHTDPKFKCDVCKQKFSHAQGLKTHIREQHGPKEIHICPHCQAHGKFTKRAKKGDLNTHMETCQFNPNKKPKPRCPFAECFKQYVNNAALNMHIKQVHGKRDFSYVPPNVEPKDLSPPRTPKVSTKKTPSATISKPPPSATISKPPPEAGAEGQAIAKKVLPKKTVKKTVKKTTGTKRPSQKGSSPPRKTTKTKTSQVVPPPAKQGEEPSAKEGGDPRTIKEGGDTTPASVKQGGAKKTTKTKTSKIAPKKTVAKGDTTPPLVRGEGEPPAKLGEEPSAKEGGDPTTTKQGGDTTPTVPAPIVVQPLDEPSSESTIGYEVKAPQLSDLEENLYP